MGNVKTELGDAVGPVLKSGDIADVVAEAVQHDNPDREFKIDDSAGYVRIETSRECWIRRTTVENLLGRPFSMQELGIVLTSFAGRVETTPDYFRFFLSEDVSAKMRREGSDSDPARSTKR